MVPKLFPLLTSFEIRNNNGDEEHLFSLDRLVLLGNHRDAWTSGAGDASSGQAALLEIGRALGTLKKKGS